MQTIISKKSLKQAFPSRGILDIYLRYRLRVFPHHSKVVFFFFPLPPCILSIKRFTWRQSARVNIVQLILLSSLLVLAINAKKPKFGQSKRFALAFHFRSCWGRKGQNIMVTLKPFLVT